MYGCPPQKRHLHLNSFDKVVKHFIIKMTKQYVTDDNSFGLGMIAAIEGNDFKSFEQLLGVDEEEKRKNAMRRVKTESTNVKTCLLCNRSKFRSHTSMFYLSGSSVVTRKFQ